MSSGKANKQKGADGSNKKKSKKPALVEIDAKECGDVKYIDTHVHVDTILKKLHETPEGLHSKFPSNFEGCVCIFCWQTDYSDESKWRELLEENDWCYGSFGIHPHDAQHFNADLKAVMLERLAHPKVVALGECGLDYFRLLSDKDSQKFAFRSQIQMAVELKKPLVIHCRDAHEDVLEIMKQEVTPDLKMHLHCFTGTLDEAKTMLEEFPNLFLGLTGVVTRAAHMKEVVEYIPLDRLLLETDGPYMMPRNVPNVSNKDSCHSGYIPYVAKFVAESKGISIMEVLEAARTNTKRMYSL
jgi:TatD DNase family protein